MSYSMASNQEDFTTPIEGISSKQLGAALKSFRKREAVSPTKSHLPQFGSSIQCETAEKRPSTVVKNELNKYFR